MEDSDDSTGSFSLSDVAPDVAEFTYSREESVAAIKTYFDFLTKLYLDTEAVVMPPAGGWPYMENIQELGKTEEVVDLLRHFPYIVRPPGAEEIHIAGYCDFTDWPDIAQHVAGLPRPLSASTVQSVLYATQSSWYYIPSSVVGLVSTKDFQMFLDTRFGMMYFIGTHAMPGPTRVAEKTYELFRPVRDDPHDYAPVEEASWRGGNGSRAWAIPEFFKMLEFHFQELNYVPTGRLEVEEAFDEVESAEEEGDDETSAALLRIKGIFREHGWLDLDQYCKRQCIEAVESVAKVKLSKQPAEVLVSLDQVLSGD